MRAIPAVSLLIAVWGTAFPAAANSAQTSDPFPEPIEPREGAIVVDVVEYASIPDVDGEPARMMTLVNEPGTDRLFLSDQRGIVYLVGAEGETVVPYLDIRDPTWGVDVESSGRERGLQSFALHPGFADPESPGHGRIYVWTDTRSTNVDPDFRPGGGDASHHTVLLEFAAGDPAAERYDGGPPRELVRFEQPYGNHNGGEIAFNPLAAPDDPDYGLLYVGSADGGSGGDPHDMAGDRASAYGKVLRIDPLGSNGTGGEYGVPAANPFVDTPDTLGEIYLLGLRNPQHLSWDPATGDLFVADVGQNAVEEVSRAAPGADLGWNEWEGSFRFVSRSGVDVEDPRGDPGATFPVVEYDHHDPLFGNRAAVTGLVIMRDDTVAPLEDRLLFGDLPSGELFHVDADALPEGGQAAIRRVLFRPADGHTEAGDGAQPGTLLDLVRNRNREQGRSPSARVDLRLGEAPGGRIFLLNKHDGALRLIVPPAS